MSEDSAESTEQVVPATWKVPETILNITECINSDFFEYMGKGSINKMLFPKREYGIYQTQGENKIIIAQTLLGKEREFSGPRLFQYVVLNFY